MYCKTPGCTNERGVFGKQCSPCAKEERAAKAGAREREREKHGVCMFIRTDGKSCVRPRVDGTLFCSYHPESWQADHATRQREAEEARVLKLSQKVIDAKDALSAVQNLLYSTQHTLSQTRSQVADAKADLAKHIADAQVWAPEPMLAKAAELATTDPVGNANAIMALTELAKESRLARTAKTYGTTSRGSANTGRRAAGNTHDFD